MMRLQEIREHRWSHRRPVETGLRVYTPGQRPWPGRICNLSIGGMFAKIDVRTLSPNDPVDVAFVLQQGDGPSHHRLPARVIWIGLDGAGLMFTDFSRETLNVLRATLRSGPAPARPEDVI